MVTIGKVLARTFSTDETTETFQMLAIFCLTGLLVCVLVANYGAHLNMVWPEVNF